MSKNDLIDIGLDLASIGAGLLVWLDIVKDILAALIVIMTFVLTLYRFVKTFKKKNEQNVNNSRNSNTGNSGGNSFK